MECEHCGAPVRDAGAFCSHCGGRRRPAPAPVAATSAERFDLAASHPGHATARGHRPTLTTTPVTGAWIAVVASVVVTFVMIGLVVLLERQHADHRRRIEELTADLDHAFDASFRELGVEPPVRPSGAPKPTPPPASAGPGWLFFVFVPVCLLGVGAAARSLVRARRFVAAPLRHELAVVVDERVSVRGGGRNGAASTQYHASLQTRDGQRREYLCEGQLAGRIAANDIGVAFLKADHLIDFIRLEV